MENTLVGYFESGYTKAELTQRLNDCKNGCLGFQGKGIGMAKCQSNCNDQYIAGLNTVKPESNPIVTGNIPFVQPDIMEEEPREAPIGILTSGSKGSSRNKMIIVGVAAIIALIVILWAYKKFIKKS